MWNGYRATKRRSTVGGPPKFKIVLLGETGVGKSSLFMRLKDDVFGPGIQPTVGIESCSKLVEVDGDQIVLQVWDTAGVERYRTLTRNYYRNTHASFLVYSVDNPSTLHYLSKWIQDIHDSAPNAMRFLIGNKIDLERLVSDESVQDFAAAHDCDSAFYVSAKTGHGLDDVLLKMGEKLLETFQVPWVESETQTFDRTIQINANSKRQDPSCSC